MENFNQTPGDDEDKGPNMIEISSYLDDGELASKIEAYADKDDAFREKLMTLIIDAYRENSDDLNKNALKWAESQGSLMIDMIVELQEMEPKIDSDQK